MKHHMSIAAIVGAAAVCASVTGAPLASADDPNTDCSEQAVPNSDQQCNQQQGPGMPQLPKNSNSNNSNAQQPQQAPPSQSVPAQNPQPPPKQGIDLSDKNCWLINGVPTMWNPALATGPGDVVQWCPQVYGLTPH